MASPPPSGPCRKTLWCTRPNGHAGLHDATRFHSVVEREEHERCLSQASPHEHTFTEQEVLTILRNMGHDVECGACMAIAFTGLGLPGDRHTCKKCPTCDGYMGMGRVCPDCGSGPGIPKVHP